MRNIIRKSIYFGVLLAVFLGFVSCEDDFTSIGTSIINNTAFTTGEMVLDVQVTPKNIESVRADNIAIGTLGEYWLGIYNNNPNAKGLKADIISQISYVHGLLNRPVTSTLDTIFNLDKVVLILPYTSTRKANTTEGKPTFALDSILGNTNVLTTVKVFRNGTFLNKLNPLDPSKDNIFSSDREYLKEDVLTKPTGFSFVPKATDTVFKYNRIDRMASTPSNIKMYEEAIRIKSNKKEQIPFLAIPLDLNKMKTLFWDKFKDREFSSAKEFQKYFKGIILKAQGTDGALIPFNLNASPTPSINFYYSKTILSNHIKKDTINRKYSFSLSGLRNSKYEMSPARTPAPANNFVIQGTAGSVAQIKILGVKLANLNPDDAILKYRDKDLNGDGYLDLKELSTIKDIDRNQLGLLINDASLIFNINSTVNANKNKLPQRLFIYQNKENENGGIIPTPLFSYKEVATFGGYLKLAEDKIHGDYTFKITDYVSRLLNRVTTDFSPLELKVYNNKTDKPSIKNLKVESYNWNPRAVTLLNGNKRANGVKKAQLKIYYSEKNNLQTN